MKPISEESLDELIVWYEQVYTPQVMGDRPNAAPDPERMRINAAVVRDAVYSYRTWREMAPAAETLSLEEFRAGNAPHDSDKGLRVTGVDELTISERFKTRFRRELERPGQINIDARQQFEFPPTTGKPRPNYATCGNCGERRPLLGDPVADHHNAMRHASVCPQRPLSLGEAAASSNSYKTEEYARLIAEHAAQPMQVLFRERAEAEQLAIEQRERPQLAAPEAIVVNWPETPKKPEAPARWWQFWKW